MSELKQQITSEMKAAMRARNKERLGTIRMILAEIKRIEIDERIELDDSRVLATLDKMSKQRRDSVSQFEAANRLDLVEIERRELEVIKTFLPQPLNDEEINKLVDQAITASGAQSMQDMGKVMGVLKPQIQGRADVGTTSKLVKQRLAN